MESAQLASAKAEIDRSNSALCVTCKFNPAPSIVTQNCTALVIANDSSVLRVLRISRGQFDHNVATKCFDSSTDVYMLKVFSGWDAQCSRNYHVINLEVTTNSSYYSEN